MASNIAEAEFDIYAKQYESALNQGLNVSGESSLYFAEKRIEWTARLIPERIHSVLDFGCGIGMAIPSLQHQFEPELTWGFDPSSQAIDRAFGSQGDEITMFTSIASEIPSSAFQLAYCNGVFHHIRPEQRDEAFSIILRALMPGGWFAFWENNPWNPGTRYVMSKIPFDQDAITISPRDARPLILRSGFDIVCLHSRFVFPRLLAFLRPLESLVYKLPIGAQYLVLARKPH